MATHLPMYLLQPPFLCLRRDERGWVVSLNGIRVRPLPGEVTNQHDAIFYLLDIYRLFHPKGDE